MTKTSRMALILGAALICGAPVFSQKQTTNIGQAWMGYLNQTRLSDKWGLWADFHLRTKEDVIKDFSTGIARVGLTYYLTEQVKLTAGYAYINHFPAENHTGISQPEHRPWQQVQWHTQYKKSRMMQWIRLEQRYRRKIKNNEELAEGYNFNFRLRYNLFYAVPLTKKGFDKNGLSLILNDEIHINWGKEITYNYFDQNRFFVGLGYQLSKSENIQFGYMNLFQQLAAGNRYRNIHAFRVFFFQNLDFRKK